MAGQASVLDDNFVVNQSGGVTRYTALVQGPNDHECSNPSAGGVGGFLGVAQEDQDTGITANVRMAGNTFVKAVGPIAKGQALIIGDATGRVDAHANAAGKTITVKEVIGYALTSATAANDLLLMSINKTFVAD